MLVSAAYRFFRGPSYQPSWERPLLLLLLLSNTILYSFNLHLNGWANYFYSAAVQAGSFDAEALFYGSSDWGNSITVDKPPFSLWIMGLSVRVFGFTPLAMLLPQVLMGVATTLMIYIIVRSHIGPAAALFSALIFFTTPIVTLMSRYNNPDPLMLLLMVAGAWFVIRSIESGLGRHFVIAAAFLGLAFMTKQLQGLLCVPAFGMAYLLLSRQPWLGRFKTIGASVGALFLTGGLWIVVVDLIPKDERPYIGGSPMNSVFQLTFGYNGIGRIVGAEVLGASEIPNQFRPVDSDAGWFRLLNPNYNQETSWLLFGALLAVVLIGICWRKRFKTRQVQALALIACFWLLTAFFLLSFMGNQIHTYYTAALAPPLSLVMGITLDLLIKTRKVVKFRIAGAIIVLTALLSTWLILTGTDGWPSWLPSAILGAGIVSMSALLATPPSHKVEVMAGATLCGALLCGPILTSVHNVTVGFSGSNPISGVPSKNSAGISHLLESIRKDELPREHDIAIGRTPNDEVIELLARSNECIWAAATYPSQTAARLQLGASRPVMPIGGFEGNDPAPTLEAFKSKVNAGQICYFLEQATFLEGQQTESSVTTISSWVRSNYRPETIGRSVVFRLTSE